MESKIKLIMLDIDGVLTDGKITLGSDGKELKSFNVKDGLGISMAHFAGLKLAICTGRVSQAVEIRAQELKIEYVYQGIKDKLAILNNLVKNLGIDYSEVCFMGDDINDLPVIKQVGLSFAPSDAVELVRDKAAYVTKVRGGEGAVREMLDRILKIQFDYEKLVLDYLKTNSTIIQ